MKIVIGGTGLIGSRGQEPERGRVRVGAALTVHLLDDLCIGGPCGRCQGQIAGLGSRAVAYPSI